MPSCLDGHEAGMGVASLNAVPPGVVNHWGRRTREDGTIAGRELKYPPEPHEQNERSEAQADLGSFVQIEGAFSPSG